ncbi:MAG TPA: hypothetical protein PKW08_01220 [Flavobacteriaceae bacterium]|nr:hypothetical protein [Flavobacteriaceae bacterium]MCB9212433.1 hypothetical protein [Alteromonas sp.]HPF11709.1 hypothetical protein [Flavobacteriaceae bacterium]HQU20184.1 hypothetical protein [Flavobacteriaceae bacterium]HQU64727.1 hypothetical protein [Flavobacteriaceae bacterium]
MKFVYASVIAFVLISCGKKTAEQIPLLNGYWEIEHVTLADGTKKQYSVNTVVDFIEVNGLIGIRKKMMPQPDGTFKTTNQTETFAISTGNGELRLQYKTPFDQWIETVLELDDQKLVVKNEAGNTYHYKRFQPLSLNNE